MLASINVLQLFCWPMIPFHHWPPLWSPTPIPQPAICSLVAKQQPTNIHNIIIYISVTYISAPYTLANSDLSLIKHWYGLQNVLLDKSGQQKSKKTTVLFLLNALHTACATASSSVMWSASCHVRCNWYYTTHFLAALAQHYLLTAPLWTFSWLCQQSSVLIGLTDTEPRGSKIWAISSFCPPGRSNMVHITFYI